MALRRDLASTKGALPQLRYARLSGEAKHPSGARPSKCIIILTRPRNGWSVNNKMPARLFDSQSATDRRSLQVARDPTGRAGYDPVPTALDTMKPAIRQGSDHVNALIYLPLHGISQNQTDFEYLFTRALPRHPSNQTIGDRSSHTSHPSAPQPRLTFDQMQFPRG
jgi:hypothetical protein